jgi:3-hydroxyisobutyrate dehydrogenase
MTAPTLGFVGLGRIGGPMCGRLAAAGNEVLAFDAAGTDERLPAGAVAASSIAALAARAEVVLVSVPDGAASQSVAAELLPASPRAVRAVIDLSTIGVAAARACHALLAGPDIAYLDAPVSGGVAGARQGTLALMVAGPREVFEEYRPVFDALGTNVFFLGEEPGQGQAMKLINNFLNGTALAATSEAVLLGTRFGLTPQQTIEVLNASTGRTSASTDKFPRSVIPGTYDFGFGTELMAKDLQLYAEVMERSDVPHEIGTTVHRLWQEFAAACPGTDFTYIYEFLTTRAASDS